MLSILHAEMLYSAVAWIIGIASVVGASSLVYMLFRYGQITEYTKQIENIRKDRDDERKEKENERKEKERVREQLINIQIGRLQDRHDLDVLQIELTAQKSKNDCLLDILRMALGLAERKVGLEAQPGDYILSGSDRGVIQGSRVQIAQIDIDKNTAISKKREDFTANLPLYHQQLVKQQDYDRSGWPHLGAEGTHGAD